MLFLKNNTENSNLSRKVAITTIAIVKSVILWLLESVS